MPWLSKNDAFFIGGNPCCCVCVFVTILRMNGLIKMTRTNNEVLIKTASGKKPNGIVPQTNGVNVGINNAIRLSAITSAPPISL